MDKILIHKKSILIWAFIFLILFIPMIVLGENPGLQYDAINPDYVALQILNPQNYSSLRLSVFPILGQIYHGTVNMWLTLLAVLITGSTSVLQHHIVNCLVVFVSLLLMNSILKRNGIREYIRYGGLLVFASLPTVMTVSLTQFYIELPGTAFVLLATLLYEKGMRSNSKHNRQYICGLAFYFIGLAFYSYFNHLFFAFGFLFFFVLCEEKVSGKIINFLVGCYGLVCGAVLYPIGYMIMYLKNTGKSELIVGCSIAMFVGVYLAAGIFFVLLKKNNIHLAIVMSGVVASIGVILLVTVYKPLFETMDLAKIVGNPVPFYERIRLLWLYFYNAISAGSSERFIYGSTQTSFQFVFIWIFVAVNIVYFIYMISRKKSFKNSMPIRYLVILIMYLTCCIGFASRMQTQHFIPLVFWTFLIIVSEIGEMCDSVNLLCIKRSNVLALAYVSVAFLFLLNVAERYKIINSILYTGGKGYYTNQINVLSEEALINADNGEKEIYIFPEWGFATGFDYLTQNKIAFSLNTNEQSIAAYIGEGYEIVIVYWNEENTEKYVELFNDVDNLIFEHSTYFNDDGDIAFYKIEGKASSLK